MKTIIANSIQFNSIWSNKKFKNKFLLILTPILFYFDIKFLILTYFDALKINFLFYFDGKINFILQVTH